VRKCEVQWVFQSSASLNSCLQSKKAKAHCKFVFSDEDSRLWVSDAEEDWFVVGMLVVDIVCRDWFSDGTFVDVVEWGFDAVVVVVVVVVAAVDEASENVMLLLL
jgi:hypothetical protein